MLSTRFEEALRYAHRIHNDQRRKGTAVPYISHLMAVAALVLEDGGDEDQAIAALLHDAAEDRGGHARLVDIRKKFGPQVAAIVESCSDSLDLPKPPWGERKRRYVEHLEREASPEACRVSAADKLHNARSILRDYRQVGDAVWDRFKASREETLGYYRALADVFQKKFPGFLATELDRMVSELERLAGGR